MYNPEKNYTWDKDATFELTGAEFGMLLNTFRAILNTEQAMQILLVDKASSIMEHKMSEYVEKGTIKEVHQNESKEVNIKETPS